MSAAAIILALVTLQRLGELVLARRNTQLLLARGAIEVGAKHYPPLVAMHAAWLIALLLGVLGDVSRRTEVGAPVRIPSADEIAQPHIDFDPDLSSETRQDERPVTRSVGRIAEPSTRAEPPAIEKPALEKFPGMPLFDDLPSVPNAREATAVGMDPNATAAALGRMVAKVAIQP